MLPKSSKAWSRKIQTPWTSMSLKYLRNPGMDSKLRLSIWAFRGHLEASFWSYPQYNPQSSMQLFIHFTCVCSDVYFVLFFLLSVLASTASFVKNLCSTCYVLWWTWRTYQPKFEKGYGALGTWSCTIFFFYT